MANNDLDLEIDRTGTFSKRWQGKGTTLALTIGDSDFLLPEPIRHALVSRLDGVVGYDHVPEKLIELIVNRMQELYSWSIHPDWLVFLPGVVPGINFACAGLTDSAQAVATETPIYYPFLDVPANCQRAKIDIPAFQDDGRWHLNLDLLERSAQDNDIGMLLFCNPQNPLGRVSSRDELMALAELCLQHNIVICSDEIHCDLTFDDHQHIPIASLHPEIAASSVTLMSPSKAFGISGIGGAFAVIPNADLRARFEAAAAGVNMGMTALPITAMQAAYGECQSWFAETKNYLEGSRDFLCDALSASRLKFVKPQGTYFLWLDFSQSGLNNPYEALIEAGVELSNGEAFGDSRFLRLNFASPRNRLETALARIQTLSV